MKISAFLKELDISKWSAIWAFLTDGWAGLAKLICTAFTKLLRKADPAKLKRYAELASKVAVFLRGIIETFIEAGAVRDAALQTADSVAVLAEHLADGEYTTDELDVDVDNIKACVEAWKKAAVKEAKAEDCPDCHV